MKNFISKYSGRQVDQVIRGVLSLQPKIFITNATANSRINYSSPAITGTHYIIADENGTGIILINRYGIYQVQSSLIGKNIYIDEFKPYELDFSDITNLPIITSQPQDVSAIEGEQVTFLIVASDATNYQWQYQRPNETVWRIASGTSSTFSFTANSAFNNRKYRCVISNDNGFITSDAATLTITS